MFKNYIITSIRYLRRHQGYAWVNIVGLATGLVLAFFAYLFVDFELSYDTYNEKADRIYRVVTDVETKQGTLYESTWGPLAAAIRENCPEVEKATHFFLDYLIIQRDVNHFREEKVAYADASLFEVFTLPLRRGEASQILNSPGDLVLSESAALRYFGAADPIGQTLLINGKDPGRVTGIMKDIPKKSHFQVDMLVSKSTLGEGWTGNWKRFFFYTYVLLPENLNPSVVESKLPSIVANHLEQGDIRYQLTLEPLRKVYIEGKPRGSRAGSIVTGTKSNVYIFSLVGVFILFIACFNFINLSTAFSLQRVKEIGVRKVMGGSQRQLMFHFLTDSVLVSLISYVVAFGLYGLLFPLFNEVAGKEIVTHMWHYPMALLGLLGVSLLIGIISGIYPALFLSRFHPIRALKGRLILSQRGLSIRKVLVTSQFAISMLLISGTVVVYSQLDYMQSSEPGFKLERRVVVDFQYDERVNSREASIKERLYSIPGVVFVSMSSSIPGKSNHVYPVKIETSSGAMEEFQSDTYFVDCDFLKQYGIELIAGRPFSKEIASDSAEAMVVNEATTRALGYVHPGDAIGKSFQQLRWKGVIIGVIRDFHFHSFREEVRPLTMVVSKSFLTFLTLSISDQNQGSTLKSIESKWKDWVPGMPFDYFFEEESYREQYHEEAGFGKLFASFASFAIFISCLGLAGLSSFSITQRAKEIGIRKVLGSSTLGVTRLLSREWMILMIVAFVLSAPLSWWLMSHWLAGFAYRISIAWWMVLGSGVVVAVVAFVTIIFQTVKAALANPMESLRAD